MAQSGSVQWRRCSSRVSLSMGGGTGGLQNNHTWRMVTFHRDCKLDSTKVFAYFLSLTLFICAAAN